MGEAQRKKQRLGEWYGKPIEPGHPDYVPPPPPPPPMPTYDQGTAVVRIRPRYGRGIVIAMLALSLTAGLSIPPPRR